MRSKTKRVSYARNLKEFSIYREIKKSCSSSEKLHTLENTFQNVVELIFGDNIETTFKSFRVACKCRFTVIFDTWMYQPDILSLIVEKVVDTTVNIVCSDMNVSDEELTRLEFYYTLYKQGKIKQLKEILC